MTDITPIFVEILTDKCKYKPESESVTGAAAVEYPAPQLQPESRLPSTETADEFLKEAHRINSHIHSLLAYLHSIRHSYLSISTGPASTTKAHHRRTTSSSSLSSLRGQGQGAHRLPTPIKQHLTDSERDSIDSSTALLLRDLSSSIANLSSAESLRQETESTLLRKKYGYTKNLLWRWAGGSGALATTPTTTPEENKSPEQVRDEEIARTMRTFREGVLWFLRRGLEKAARLQGGMVEKRIERVREKEKSVLYKNRGRGGSVGVAAARDLDFRGPTAATGPAAAAGTTAPSYRVHDQALSQSEVANIESELSPEQLQLFAEENDIMLRHYEDTLSKVQNAEKSLLEIASLQQTLVTHLATQEDYIGQLVSDAATMETNIGRGNKELRRATERRSTAQAVFWGTVGLCTWLVIWDLVF